MDSWLLTISVPGIEPVERRLDRALLSIGSDPGADLRIASVAERWAIVRQVDAGLEVRRMGAPGARLLRLGGTLTIDGIELSLRDSSPREEQGLPVEALAEGLAGADGPSDALSVLLEGLIEATRAQTGAILLREDDDYGIPIARRSDGRPLEGAEQLLSDTVVRDVLDGGEASVCVADLAQSTRYASVPSVVSLSLSSVLCVPMRMGSRVLGAIYLGHQDPRAVFSDAHASDLAVLATMALPLLAQLRRREDAPPDPAATDQLVGESDGMRRVRALVHRVGPSDLSVLVLGETGTGKEVVARAIHAASPRAALPMIALNCAALPESLLAVELFGCKKGAYTGAVSDRKGRIEAAHGSTLFLDEVGDMPLSMQVALLRVLEERAVTRVGENTERPVDFRLVAATSLDLDAAVEEGRFRKDLLYRLRELAIHLPPLRDRGEDVALLANLFLRQCSRSLALGPHRLSSASLRALAGHAWDGNVRELRAVMRRASILCDGTTIEPEHMQLDEVAARAEPLGPLDLPLAEARDRFVARYVSTVLDRHEGNREAAAVALGISVRSLYRHLS